LTSKADDVRFFLPVSSSVKGIEHRDIMSEMERLDVGLVEGSPEVFAGTAPVIGCIVRARKALLRDVRAPGNIVLAEP
jgi:hypothetical protein